MTVIGLTGPTGSGKSTLCNIAAEFGIKSIDADKVYHDLLVPPSLCLEAIVNAFGNGVLNEDGSLNRAVLASIVFAVGADEKLRTLNSITHKFVKEEFRRIISDMKNSAEKFVIVDAPTLYESGFDKECDFTVAIIADRSIRSTRIIERDFLSADRAEQRLSAQKPDDFFIQRANYVLYNNGDVNILKESFINVIRKHGGIDEN